VHPLRAARVQGAGGEARSAGATRAPSSLGRPPNESAATARRDRRPSDTRRCRSRRKRRAGSGGPPTPGTGLPAVDEPATHRCRLDRRASSRGSFLSIAETATEAKAFSEERERLLSSIAWRRTRARFHVGDASSPRLGHALVIARPPK